MYEQDEDDDDSAGLEIDADMALRIAKVGRK